MIIRVRKSVVLTAVYVVSVCIVIYPFFANIYNNKVNEQLLVEYEENISGISNEEIEEEYEKAVAYNNSLTTAMENSFFTDMGEDEKYESVLNLNGDGIMGSIVIPKIDVSIAIYHYDTDDILKKGVGHVQTTALPIGGEGTHAVLTGHRGLPSSKLFTDLDQLEVGDRFYIRILNSTLAYEVTDIKVVEPTDVESLAVVEGKDLVTLVTCTPYGINTHRLLVTGERVIQDDETTELEISSAEVERSIFSPDYMLLYFAVAETLVYFALIRVLRKRKANRRS